MEINNAISAENLSFSYSSGTVFSNLDFTVHSGDFLALIGPNGGGKTTFLKLVLGILQPQTGKVRIFDKAPAEVCQSVGYVPQYSTLRNDFPAPLLDAVLMGAAQRSMLGGFWPRDGQAKDRAMTLLEKMKLPHLAHKDISALSGGERQRALIARALMGRKSEDAPFLLLLDEPTASIDPAGKFCFYDFLTELKNNSTIVIVSHEMLLTSPYFTRVVYLNHTIQELPVKNLTPETLSILFGEHEHTCPVSDLHHVAQVHSDCCPQFQAARNNEPSEKLRSTSCHHQHGEAACQKQAPITTPTL